MSGYSRIATIPGQVYGVKRGRSAYVTRGEDLHAYTFKGNEVIMVVANQQGDACGRSWVLFVHGGATRLGSIHNDDLNWVP